MAQSHEQWPFREGAAPVVGPVAARPRTLLGAHPITCVVVVLLALGLWIYLMNSRHIRCAALAKERLRTRVRAMLPLMRAKTGGGGTPRTKDPALLAALGTLESVPAENDEYFFVLDHDGHIWANGGQPSRALSDGARPGPSMLQMEQPDAKDAKPLEAIVRAAQQGGGFVVYDWNHPTTGEIKPKMSYVQEVPGTALILGCGHYM